ncbi:MAG: glycosyltransferase [Thermodesulfobacteriota bacterium]|nr:glycosyltransferase [Thermodesulfobacteriota bacterium]
MTLTASVIIPAKNEEKNIPACLEGVKNQTLAPLEYIVVDNGSTDKTVEIAGSYGAKVVVIPDVSVGELRNRGAAEARGEVLAFLDADCVPEGSWLDIGCQNLLDESVGAVGSSVLASNSGSWIEEAWFFNIKNESGKVKYIGSANLILKKALFDAIGGFNAQLQTGEDRDLSWKIQERGMRTVCDERIKVKHYGYPKTVMAFFKRELWHGKAIASDFNNISKSRMIYILAFLSLMLLSSILCLLSKQYMLFLLLLTLILIAPFSISFIKSYSKKNYSFLWPLTILYFVYLTARLFSFYRFCIIFLVSLIKPKHKNAEMKMG